MDPKNTVCDAGIHPEVQTAHTFTFKTFANLPTCLFLGGGKKPGNHEETHVDRTPAQAQAQTEDPGAVRWHYYQLHHNMEMLHARLKHTSFV